MTSLSALPQLLADGIVLGSLFALLAVSFGLILAPTGIFHFAHGLSIAVGAYASYSAAEHLHWLPSVLVGMTVAGLLGVAVERSIYRPMIRQSAPTLNLFLASLGVLIVGETALQFQYGASPRVVEAPLEGVVRVGSVALARLDLALVVVCWLVVIAVAVAVGRSRYGQAIRGIASNGKLAEHCGIETRAVTMGVFLVGSALAGLGGVLLGYRSGATPTMGLEPLLAAFVAVFAAGLTRFFSMGLAGLGLGLLTGVSGLFLPGYLQNIVTFAVLFGFLVLRPERVALRA